MSLSTEPASVIAPPEQRVGTGALLGWTYGALSLTAGVLALVVWVAGQPQWWTCLTVATAIGFAAASLGLFPIILVAARGTPSQISFGFLAGTMLRVMAAMAMLLLVARFAEIPRKPTAFFTVAYYFAALAAEVLVLVAGLRRSFPIRVPGTTAPGKVSPGSLT